MHTFTTGAQKRPNTHNHKTFSGVSAAVAMPPSGLLTKDDLRRLVAAMVD